MFKRNQLIIFLVVFLVGCSTWKDVLSGSYTNAKTGFSTVAVSDDWKIIQYGSDVLMTRDGIVLNKIVIVKQKFAKELNSTKQMFQSSMSPQELADVEIDQMKSKAGVNDFEVLTNKAVTIDGRPGYRVDFEFIAEGGLRYKGIHCGFAYNDRIYRIQYQAAKQHYYDHDIKYFEEFLAQFKLIL